MVLTAGDPLKIKSFKIQPGPFQVDEYFFNLILTLDPPLQDKQTPARRNYERAHTHDTVFICCMGYYARQVWKASLPNWGLLDKSASITPLFYPELSIPYLQCQDAIKQPKTKRRFRQASDAKFERAVAQKFARLTQPPRFRAHTFLRKTFIDVVSRKSLLSTREAFSGRPSLGKTNFRAAHGKLDAFLPRRVRVCRIRLRHLHFRILFLFVCKLCSHSPVCYFLIRRYLIDCMHIHTYILCSELQIIKFQCILVYGHRCVHI